MSNRKACTSQLRPLPEIARCDVLCVPGGSGCTRRCRIKRSCSKSAAGRRCPLPDLGVHWFADPAAAGLLAGKRPCHWSMRDSLALFGAIPSAARVERDGNVISGGGVAAGIDFALALIAELHGEDTAQTIQLYGTPRPRRSRAARRNWPRRTFTPVQAQMAESRRGAEHWWPRSQG
ncbi:hypothetical protein M8494_19200 [Serratia ureilytica]